MVFVLFTSIRIPPGGPRTRQLIEAKLKETDSTAHTQTEAKEQLTVRELADKMSPISLTITDTRDTEEPSSKMVAGSNTIVGAGGFTTATGKLTSESCELADMVRVP